MTYSTDQEVFWQGDFGNEYTDRNRGQRWLASNSALFSTIVARTNGVRSVLELGSNIGLNLMPLRELLPDAELSAVEINERAAAELRSSIPDIDLHQTSILEFSPSRTWDLVFTKGVLIHIDPDALPSVYSKMYESSDRYVLVAEYYSPKPVELPYRGHSGKLFKRDFAGEMLDQFPDLRLLDYGFAYHRDPNFPQDDTTWFLLQKG